MTEIERIKIILKEMGISSTEMADVLGITLGSYRAMTGKGVKVTPKWVTSFLYAWELAYQDLLCIDCKARTNGYGHEYLFCQECASEK